MNSTLPLNIYAEATPNPASMKFVANIFLLEEEGKSFEFRTQKSASISPLALKLFDLNFVRGVFITANFVTVSSDESKEWYEVIPEIKEIIKQHLIQGEPIVLQGAVQEDLTPAATTDIEKRIADILDEYIRPAVEGDGGAIELQSYDKGKVSVILRGSCSGCPSSTLTLKAGIENLLRRMVPEVEEVVAYNG